MEIIFTPEFYENDVLIVSTIMNNLSKKDKLNLLYIFISMILGGIFTALFCLRDKNKNKNNKKEIKLEEYLDKGNLELKNLLEEDISDERLEEISKEFIEEITPNGLVRLSYNKDKESFTYYSNEDIAYKYLEVVSRLFVIKYNVKKLYINYIEELIKARDIKLKKTTNLTVQESSNYAISKNKKLPENLSDLKLNHDFFTNDDKDYWGNPIIYKVTEGHVMLISYGADQKKGDRFEGDLVVTFKVSGSIENK